ncbi:MAG: sulfur carrier protein ThiS adenylyltransferase ThiF [Candidatus Omnitrophica bacterium]|nr:sulfur carrier protein ThiS adenylyltransferase ThiF [Candidatus Omnitrophota bacterium]MDD5487812.1 sulfur carrier protein ThiS adenylyltransferase ThiF [Candidatus Omnitrophota bacterium]
MKSFREEVISLLGREGFERVSSARIGIAGAGGLGSNCAMNLVRSGFNDILIVDHDVVEVSNLTRQFYFRDQVGKNKVDALKENLLLIDPDLDIKCEKTRLSADNITDIFADREVVVEALDKAEEKSMLVSEFASSDKFVVSVSGIAGYGRSDEIKLRRIGTNLVMIGDMLSDVREEHPFSPRVNIAAAKQADVVLEYVLSDRYGTPGRS